MTEPRPGNAARRLIQAALVASLAVASCASGEPAVTGSASKILNADVQRLQVAARAGDRTEIARAGDQLRVDLAAQRASGQISSARADAVLDQLARVLADSAALPVVTATPSPSPSRSREHGKGKDDGGDKGVDKG
jgi:hypothetical protein